MSTTIFHNPRCSTSRNALALIQASGEVPNVVEYLKNPPTREELVQLLQKMNASPEEIIRSKEAVYTELGLEGSETTSEQLIDAMAEHPILINRPIVITDKGAVLCRPLEKIFAVLPTAVSEFTKENGEVIVNPNG